jgi:hypothetical protein
MKRLLFLLALCTIPLALGATLGDYPDLLLEQDEYDGLIVVGEDAPSSDVVAAANVVQTLPGAQPGVSTLDTDVTNYMYNTNHIVSVGCNNDVTERITNMTCDDFTQPGIYLYQNDLGTNHLVITGGTAEQTRTAATTFIQHNLTGTAVIIKNGEPTPTTLPQPEPTPTATEPAQDSEEAPAADEPPEPASANTTLNDTVEAEIENRSDELERKVKEFMEDEPNTTTPERERPEEPPQNEPETSFLQQSWNGFVDWFMWFFE